MQETLSRANSLSVKTPPPLVTLDAGEASGHQRRVLCITCCSLLSSPEFIVVSISRVSILVVSNFASLSDPIAASLTPLLVTAVSPVLLLVTTHTLTASRKARSRRLIGSARCFVSTVTPLGVFLPPELAIRHPVSLPVGTLELLVRNPLRRIQSNGTLGMGFHLLISGLWISSGSNERNRSRYGNIGALALSLASDPIPLLNIAKRLSSPRSGSEQYSVLINLTQRFSISSIPATPRVIRSSKHTEPAIPTDVVLACYHPFTMPSSGTSDPWIPEAKLHQIIPNRSDISPFLGANLRVLNTQGFLQQFNARQSYLQ
ncbi:Uncharacterized protein Rs2_18229 [Raphanus sativus]|nr:Uncharacterized protein Rs2_18229 [Raphanus sativus]